MDFLDDFKMKKMEVPPISSNLTSLFRKPGFSGKDGDHAVIAQAMSTPEHPGGQTGFSGNPLGKR